MANTKQAKKRALQGEKRRVANASKRSEMRTYLKQVVKYLEEGNVSMAKTLYVKATSMVDKMANKGLIHQNKANRHKSRLASHIKALEATAQ